MSNAINAVFQSTLPGRERRLQAGQRRGRAHFNPRSREGSDKLVPSLIALPLIISIHAPGKGATNALPQVASWIGYFNPRSREGSDRLPGW